jgi:FkbM family methyltransferase
MRLTRRIADVYRERGLAGVAAQTASKISYWQDRLSFRPHIIEKTLAGHTFTVAINNYFAQGWVERRTRWPELEWLKDNFLEHGDYVVDCGANMGFTTIFFAHFVGPSGKVIAVEPHPANVRDLRQNILLNGLTNVDVRETAVGSGNGVVELCDAPNGIIVAGGEAKIVQVPIVRLDDAVCDRQPTFLKIDVEGHELEVLKGAARILSGRPKLDIEVHPVYCSDPKAHCQAVFDIIGSLDYKLFLQPRVDGDIKTFELTPAAVNELAAQRVFHIFARPRE